MSKQRKKPDKSRKDKAQEIADRYGVFLYRTNSKIVGVGMVRHDGYDCSRVRRAVEEAARLPFSN